MEQIIDAEYKEVTPLEDKSVTTLTAEANELYARAESVAAVSMMMLVETGKRLQIIKERVGHGGWEDWMKENLSFSGRKANRIMKLAEKADEEGGLFANPTTLSDIEISKVWALLEAPEEVAKEVVETEPVEDMTVKNLREELKRIKEENRALEAATEEERRNYERTAQTVRELEGRLMQANEQREAAERQLAAVPDSSELESELEARTADVSKLEADLATAKKDMRDYRAKVRQEQDALKEKAAQEVKAEAEKAAAGRIREATEQAKAAAAEEIKGLQHEIGRLQKMADPAVGEFRKSVDILQQVFNACLGAIDKAAPENRDKWRAALKKVVIEGMGGQL